MDTSKPLNKGQQEAADAFFHFLFTDEKEMGVSGPGGVGKSFWMGHIIDVIMPRYFETCKLMGIEPEYDEVHMTALTNKASEVLAEATKRPTSTIYSYMNLKVEDDYTTGKSKITPTRMWTVHQRKIIFIDECSMIDAPLDSLIQKGTHKCKIVYVGDDRQLNPVMGGQSPIYRRGIKFFELTEPMRTQVPELLAINQQLRETVKTGVFEPIRIIPGIIDWLSDEGMQEAIEHFFKEQTDDARILAYTNKQVLAYNDYIRDLRGLPAQYGVGEFLINNTAIHAPGRMISVEEEVEIVNQAGSTEFIQLTNEVALEVRRSDLRSKIGDILPGIPLPVDRQHYTDLIKYFAKLKNWSKYFELKNFYPDLRPRDAATGYKAQGSTYEVSFVDVGDISTCRNADQAARLLYVTFSRARQRVILYGDLAPKFGGLIQ